MYIRLYIAPGPPGRGYELRRRHPRCHTAHGTGHGTRASSRRSAAGRARFTSICIRGCRCRSLSRLDSLVRRRSLPHVRPAGVPVRRFRLNFATARRPPPHPLVIARHRPAVRDVRHTKHDTKPRTTHTGDPSRPLPSQFSKVAVRCCTCYTRVSYRDAGAGVASTPRSQRDRFSSPWLPFPRPSCSRGASC